MEIIETLIDATAAFFTSFGALTTWFETDIEIPGIITASPLDMLLSWPTLSIIVLAVIIKKLVPVA